jgi:hypothetical protein
MQKTYAIRDRKFYENVAGQSGNSRYEALARIALQIQLSGTIANANAEFAESAAHGATTSYKHSRLAILCASPFSFGGASAIPRRRSLRAFPMKQRLAKAEMTSRLSESCHK